MTRKCCSPRLRSSKWFIRSHRKWNKWLKWWFFEKSWESLKIPRHFCFKICWNVRPSSPEVASIGLHIQGFTSETWHRWISVKICQVDDLKVNKSKDVRIQVLIDSRPNLFCKLRQMFLLCVKFGEVVLLVSQKRYVPEARALCERKELLLR